LSRNSSHAYFSDAANPASAFSDDSDEDLDEDAQGVVEQWRQNLTGCRQDAGGLASAEGLEVFCVRRERMSVGEDDNAAGIAIVIHAGQSHKARSRWC